MSVVLSKVGMQRLAQLSSYNWWWNQGIYRDLQVSMSWAHNSTDAEHGTRPDNAPTHPISTQLDLEIQIMSRCYEWTTSPISHLQALLYSTLRHGSWCRAEGSLIKKRKKVSAHAFLTNKCSMIMIQGRRKKSLIKLLWRGKFLWNLKGYSVTDLKKKKSDG